MDVIDQARRVMSSAAQRVAKNQGNQKNADRIVPIKQLEAVILDAFIGVRPGTPANRAGDHHQQSKRKRLRREHYFSLTLRRAGKRLPFWPRNIHRTYLPRILATK